MNSIFNRVSQLTESLKSEGLEEFVPDLEKVKALTRENEDEDEEDERPLYRANPTTIPGTWTEPDGDLIKTSKD